MMKIMRKERIEATKTKKLKRKKSATKKKQ